MNDDDLKRLFEETRRHFDEKAAETESVDLRFDRLTERIDNLEERMDRGFADTQGMIKFSHAELDRRVRGATFR
jgi:predicted nuclease with TOPRIM domain